MSTSDSLAHLAFGVMMQTLGRAAHQRMLRFAAAPQASQAAALRAILKACRRTERGRALALDPAWDPDAFRARVPVSSYEDIRADIERQISTGARVISPGAPRMYARTSGTTGKPKYIPVTDRIIAQSVSAQRAMSYAQHRAGRAFEGQILGFGGSTREETLSRGVPAGAASGLIYDTMPRFMRAKYVLPAELFTLEDYELKYQLAARLAAQADDVTLMACANPSTLLRLMQALNKDLATIAREVAEGGSAFLGRAPKSLAAVLAPRLRASPRRAADLHRLAALGRDCAIGEVWPTVRSVTTWLGGGCAHAAAAVRAQLPPEAIMVDGGYVASEVRGSVVLDVPRGIATPTLGDVFFEFAPVERWESGDRETRLLHEIEEGAEYYVIVSTIAGLLRYDMNDVVRVTPRMLATPTYAFVRKGRGVTSICGEKLAEDQVHAAMATLSPPPRFYVVLADARNSVYRAYIELQPPIDVPATARGLDGELARLNVEYAAKRDSGRLLPLELAVLRRGAGEAYHRHCVQTKGQREAQAKVLALQPVEQFDFDLSPWLDP